MMSLSDALLVFVLTLVSAFPAVMLSIWFSIRILFRRQLIDLPAMLQDPVVALSVRSALDKTTDLGTQGTFSKNIGNAVFAAIQPALKAYIKKELAKTVMPNIQCQFDENITEFKKCLNERLEQVSANLSAQSAELCEVLDKRLQGSFGQMAKKMKMELMTGETIEGKRSPGLADIGKILNSLGGNVGNAQNNSGLDGLFR